VDVGLKTLTRPPILTDSTCPPNTAKEATHAGKEEEEEKEGNEESGSFKVSFEEVIDSNTCRNAAVMVLDHEYEWAINLRTNMISLSAFAALASPAPKP